MSASRRKGNALEAWWAQRLHAANGHDPALGSYETPTGRLGNTYRLQIDVASVNVASECKNQESLPARLWDWLDKLQEQCHPLGKTGVLVIKRNRRRPLVVMDAQDYIALLNGRWK